MMPMDSTSRSTRTPGRSKPSPSIAFSRSESGRPAPRPSSKRPPESTESVADSFATWTGWRKSLARTYVPTRSLVVTAAAAARAGKTAWPKDTLSGMTSVS